MTDTPRTLAAIKALLADNATQAISAQDLRDAIESIVNPVVDGGFNAAFGTVQDLTAQPAGAPVSGYFHSYRIVSGVGSMLAKFYDASGSAAVETSSVGGASGWYRWQLTDDPSDVNSSFYDPEGWLVPDAQQDDDYWGMTQPPNSLLALPRGTYAYGSSAFLSDGAPVTAGAFQAFGDYASGPDYPPYFLTGDPVDATYPVLLSSPIENNAMVLNRQSVQHGLIVVSTGPYLFGPYLRYSNATVRHVSQVDFQIVRLN